VEQAVEAVGRLLPLPLSAAVEAAVVLVLSPV
jgi:hypothetical protein